MKISFFHCNGDINGGSCLEIMIFLVEVPSFVFRIEFLTRVCVRKNKMGCFVEFLHIAAGLLFIKMEFSKFKFITILMECTQFQNTAIQLLNITAKFGSTYVVFQINLRQFTMNQCPCLNVTSNWKVEHALNLIY